MRSATRAIALLGGLALTGLVLTPAVKAADIEPVVEEPGLQWYISLFGGPKWGDGDVDVEWERHQNLCNSPCQVIDHYGELHGEVDDGFLIGGAFGAQFTENFRGEIEVSGARLDTETKASEYISYEIPLSGTSYESKGDDHLRELFILANVWFGFPLSSMFSPYVGGGVGVAHVDGEFGVEPFAPGAPQITPFSASIEGDDWAFAYQLGAGLLIALSEHVAIDLGYRFKVINNVDLDDPEFCGGKSCYPPVDEFDADDDFDIHEHVAQIGLTIGF
jgi:opacity protein-like surface antigen